jgi:hypothetical protein
MAETLNSIVAIRKFLWPFSQGLGAYQVEQFAIDWCEEECDRALSYLEHEEGISIDDETYTGAVHYRADTALEVLSPATSCYRLFRELKEGTEVKHG